jgi:hypothetical protein
MKYTALKSTLNLFGKETVEVIKKDIRYKKLIETGKLLGSITYQVVSNSNGFEIDFFMIEYGKFVDEGTRYIKARGFFKDNIDKQYKKWEQNILDALAKDSMADIENILK